MIMFDFKNKKEGKEINKYKIKENNKVFSKPLNLFLSLIFISAVLKRLLLTINYQDYLIELITIVGITVYAIFCNRKYGINLFKNNNTNSINISMKCETRAYLFCLLCYVIGEFFVMFFSKRYIIAILYLPVWIIPSLIVVIKSYGKEKNSSGTDLKGVLNKLKIRTIIGSVIFGICLCGEDIYIDGKIHLDGILLTVYSMLAFGILFYWIFRTLVVKSK